MTDTQRITDCQNSVANAYLQAVEHFRFGRHDVRAPDRRVEIDLALRDVTGGAEVVADLRTASVFIAAGEVHIVMAGTAGCS